MERLELVAERELARGLLSPSIMKTSGSWFGSIGMGFAFLGVLAGCADPAADHLAKPTQARAASVASVAASDAAAPSRSSRVTTPITVTASAVLPSAATAGTGSGQATATGAGAPRPGATGTPTSASTNLKLKRLVITQAVKDREPEATPGALPSDGSAIFAFAELSNADGSSGNVRITFERKGGAEKVGDVLLPVPGNVPRYRTWAFTHFIRVPGVWEAVLWSDAGTELGRTSFEVAPS